MHTLLFWQFLEILNFEFKIFWNTLEPLEQCFPVIHAYFRDTLLRTFKIWKFELKTSKKN